MKNYSKPEVSKVALRAESQVLAGSIMEHVESKVVGRGDVSIGYGGKASYGSTADSKGYGSWNAWSE